MPHETCSLLSDRDTDHRAGVEAEEIAFDAVREDDAARRHLRFDDQFLAFGESSRDVLRAGRLAHERFSHDPLSPRPE